MQSLNVLLLNHSLGGGATKAANATNVEELPFFLPQERLDQSNGDIAWPMSNPLVGNVSYAVDKCGYRPIPTVTTCLFVEVNSKYQHSTSKVSLHAVQPDEVRGSY